jgi:flagellar hook assembly protein FlgD
MARIQYVLPYEWGNDGRLAADGYEVKITVFDLEGRRIRNLVSRRQPAGSYTLLWDCKMNTGRTVGAGVFMCTIEAGNNRAVKKIMVVR